VSDTAHLPVVLVVDDKANMVALLAKVLRADARVIKATSGAAALQVLQAEPVEVVVCDLQMPEVDGLAVLDAVRRLRPQTRFVLMTAYGSVPSAIDAMKRGAFDYLTKPFEPEALRAVVLRALHLAAAPVIPDFEPLAGLLGSSPAVAALTRNIRRVAEADVSTLVLGEPGTGKELVARSLHSLSARAARPFVVFSRGSMPGDAAEAELFGQASAGGRGPERPGLLDRAAGGTLFIDEVGELRLSLQAKLSRVLEERTFRRVGDTKDHPFDVRLVAASHRDVEVLRREGSLRPDLLYRLRVATIEVPPLRERGEDIGLLASHFLAEAALRRTGERLAGFAPDTIAMLDAYRWPGNVRELRAAIEHASIVAAGPRVEPGDLPSEIRAGSSTGPVDLGSMTYQQALEASREDATRTYLEAVLRRTHGKVAPAAEIAGIERESFYRLLRRYGVTPDDFREG
jgi:DNA-binding NtrC family response regulator